MPSDPVHAAAIMAEECGELQRAVLMRVYESRMLTTSEDVRNEAIQTAAMCMRFLFSFDQYYWMPCKHHPQSTSAEGGAQ